MLFGMKPEMLPNPAEMFPRALKEAQEAGKTSEARHRKILAHAKRQDEFSMQDVVAWIPEVPRRTLERDIAALVKKRALKAKGN
jgi:predicted HTH transcriptional regulator